MKKILYLFALLFLILGAWSCSKYNKIRKSADLDLKYKEAIRYYDNGDCPKSLALLEELVTIYKATAKAETIYYYYAYSNYCVGDYLLAAYHFRNFVKQFPNSTRAEECAYMTAYCYTLESPRYTLDQQDTKTAIKELQLFINNYPQSKRIEECNKLMDELRIKLERKYFEIAKLYIALEDYKAAITAFGILTKEFPDTRYREEAAFLTLKAAYVYATKSIEAKKAERFKNTSDLYLKFIQSFPQSKYIREAENIYSNTQRLISKL